MRLPIDAKRTALHWAVMFALCSQSVFHQGFWIGIGAFFFLLASGQVLASTMFGYFGMLGVPASTLTIGKIWCLARDSWCVLDNVSIDGSIVFLSFLFRRTPRPLWGSKLPLALGRTDQDCPGAIFHLETPNNRQLIWAGDISGFSNRANCNCTFGFRPPKPQSVI